MFVIVFFLERNKLFPAQILILTFFFSFGIFIVRKSRNEIVHYFTKLSDVLKRGYFSFPRAHPYVHSHEVLFCIFHSTNIAV